MNERNRELDTVTFHRELARLKRDGCSLLVTGSVCDSIGQEMTQKLLGAVDEQRHRVLALTDQTTEDVDGLLPERVHPDDPDVWVIDYESSSRDTLVRNGSSPTIPPSLAELREETCDIITEIAEQSGGLDAAELRVSVFTLEHLLHAHEFEAVREFVRTVSACVREVNGMVHFHVLDADGSEAVQMVADLFDARIELRRRNGETQQRWHLSGYDDPTAWVSI